MIERTSSPGWALALCGLLLAAPARADDARSDPAVFVELTSVAPGVRLDMRYATPNNFTKRAVYTDARCRLRRGVAERLARVQAALAGEGLGLLVFDCFRPLSAQRRFWALVPDSRYVANPKNGSRHNRGAAIDVTLVDSAGRPLEMGTEHDEFGAKAHRNHAGISKKAKENRARLDAAMAREGFIGLPTEWWHFDAPDWKNYPIADD